MSRNLQPGAGFLRRLSWLAVAGWVLCNINGGVAAGPTNEGPRILFLQVQFQDGAPVLRNWSVRPGHVKRRSPPDGPVLRVEVRDEAGQVLWETAVPDPRSRKIEVHDPVQRDRTNRRRVVMQNAEFTLRVPLLREARSVELFALENAPEGEGAQRRWLGRLKLPVP